MRETLEDACTEACDEYDQHSGLLSVIQEEVDYPFRVKVLGLELDVVDMDWPENDEFGLDFGVERECEQHRVEARNVELLPPLPSGHLYIAAHLDWKQTL